MTSFQGRRDVCRHCGHTRSGHRRQPLGIGTRICTESGLCVCLGFAPSHLTWDAHAAGDGTWSVQSRDTGRTFAGLPGPAAAEQLARSLSDLDDMLADITEGKIACAR